jgi:hypothetical protein
MINTMRQSEQSLLLVVLLMIMFNTAGCATGYATFSSDDSVVSGAPKDLSGVRISYSSSYESVDGELLSAYDKRDELLDYSFEKTLRSRFNILDISKTSSLGTTPKPNELRVHMSVTSTIPLFSQTWFIISALSFATIPAVATQENEMSFRLIAPNAGEKNFQYTYSERVYSWLPFLFLRPGFILPLQDVYQEERVRIVSAITTRFMVEATPFIVTHLPASIF